MKKLPLAILALGAIAISAPAFAADMALKAAPPPAPAWSWTGWYVGLNAGGSWGRSATTYTVPGLASFSTSQSMDGGLGGGQIGYNWQVNPTWVWGLEADIQGTGQRGTATLPTFVFVPPPGAVALPNTTTTATLAQKLPWFGTVRARAGVLATPTWLLYVTGGLAYGEVKSTGAISTATAFPGGPVLATATATATNNTTHAGWTIGGGFEGVVSGNWTAKLEYLYVDLGTVNNTFTGIGPSLPSVNTSSHITDNILRVGLNYHFH